ncbi:MAG TPA: glycerophosphodiester phosphodiesterase [Acidimicrobiales bacterium]|nr:glycerophosphodiester phosphodiesterase [Acidimicrobiales bacterium]
MWAHRGASLVHPGNTLGAFREAVRQGADGVELDVRCSADGGLVVCHDATLRDGRPIAELAVAELPADVPLLGPALDACEGLVVNVEIKADAAGADDLAYLAGAVASLVTDRAMQGSVVVSSFDLLTVTRLREAEPGIATAYVASPRQDPHRSLELAVEAGLDALHPPDAAVTPDLVLAAHEKGLAVRVWTVDDPARIRWHASLGVDAVITNAPALAIDALLRG